MRHILWIFGLALFLAGCAAVTTTPTPDKAQQTQDQRNRDAQGGGSY